MKFTRDTTAALAIRSVGTGEIRVGDRTVTETLVISDGDVIGGWTDSPVGDLTIDDFEVLLAARPDVVVIGTGGAGEFAPRELVFAFARLGVGLEVMDSRAAARTYNVLAGEGRRVAAVIYV